MKKCHLLSQPRITYITSAFFAHKSTKNVLTQPYLFLLLKQDERVSSRSSIGSIHKENSTLDHHWSIHLSEE